MKYKLLVFVIILVLCLVSLTGCVSKSKYDVLLVEKSSLEKELSQLQSSYDKLHTDFETQLLILSSTKRELDDIKRVYPLKDFSSYTELETWVGRHIKPSQTSVDREYGQALRVQDEAAKDGYLVSACISEVNLVFNTAVAGGNLWWWYSDEGILFRWSVIVYK